MSYKAALFKVANIYPQVLSQYLIIIPGKYNLSLLAEATSYPAVKWGEVAVPFQSRTFYRPAGLDTCEPWKIRASENQLFTVKSELQGLGLKGFDDEYEEYCFPIIRLFPLSNLLVPTNYVELLDCWIKDREAVDLDYEKNEPWKWNLSIRYSAVREPLTAANAVINEF